MSYLVCYDITDAKRLGLVAKTLERYGNRNQFSVFVCNISEAQLQTLLSKLLPLLDLNEDKLAVYPIGESSLKKGRYVGIREDALAIRSFEII